LAKSCRSRRIIPLAKLSLADHTHHDDPLIKYLYTRASQLFQELTGKSMAVRILRVVKDVESGYNKAVEILDEDVQDYNAKKRTIEYNDW
jgi:hypothetical protein